MDYNIPLSQDEWLLIRKLARTRQLSFGAALVDKVKAGGRRWTEDAAIEVHRVTSGRIPCWSMRPDLWAPGQVPPCIAAKAS